MPKVLLIDPIPSPLVERLRRLFPVWADLDVVPTSSEEDLAQRAAEAEILLVVNRKVDARLLSFVPRVRLVQGLGMGYDNLDLGALRAAGVVAAYTPGANAVAVAEHTILLMLALLKRFVAAESAVRQGGWPMIELFQAGLGELANATVGLVGFGHIGRAVAERLRPFGSRLLYMARHAVDATIEQQCGVRYAALDDLLTSSTMVSLHLPLTEATRGLIGEAELAKMPAGGLADQHLTRRGPRRGRSPPRSGEWQTRGSGPGRAARRTSRRQSFCGLAPGDRHLARGQRQPYSYRACGTDGDRQRRALSAWRGSARPGPAAISLLIPK